MILRMLLVLIAVLGLSVSGCKKEEPTPQSTMDQMKQEAEDVAEEAADEAEDVADEAEDMADDAKEAVEEAAE